MNYIKYFLGIFAVLAASRFVPHPPNFTSLLALSFYVPALLGLRYLPILLISFVITDFLIGFHNTVFFTWGSVMMVGILSQYFLKNTVSRIFGALCGCIIFFILTNFGVWALGSHGLNFSGLLECYVLGIPFFGNNLVSTLIFSLLIEAIFKFKAFNSLIKINN